MENNNNHSDTVGFDTERVDEMMVLEINFGAGKVDEVIVHFGDDPSVLAEQFAKKHNLKNTVIPAISKHISEAILEFTESNTEMRPQSPSLDATNDNDNIRSDEYLKLQGSQRLPPKDLPAKTDNLLTSPIVSTISKETLEQVSQSHEHSTYHHHHHHMKDKSPDINSDNHNNYELNSEQDGTLASSVDIALDYMIGKKNGTYDAEGNPSRGYHIVNSNRLESDREIKHSTHSNYNTGDEYTTKYDDINNESNDNLNKTNQTQNSREMTYNRIKRDWNQKSTLNVSMDTSKSVNKIQKNPKVSTSLNMGKTFDKTPLFTKITGKTANERLYNSAKLINAKKEFLQRKAAEDIERDLEASKYKINNVSRMLAENKQFHDDTFSDIGHRLHDEGITEKIKREKLFADKDDRQPLEEWSCAKCGLFHKLPTTKIFQQNINLECPNCKWLQSAAIPHQPANIAIELGTIDPTDVLRKRWQGNTNGNIDLHEYLFANKQLQASKINNLRSQWAEIDSRLPFKPIIPENSEQILKQKMEEIGEAALKLKKSLKNKNLEPGEKILEPGEYFHMPVGERLFRYKLKSKEPAPRKKIVLSGFYEQEMHDAPKRSSSELDMLASRLTYEYKEIESRRQQAVVEVYSTDPKTKQPFFKPVVIPPPSTHNASVISSIDLQDSKKRDIFTELLEQSDIKIRNRLLEQQRFYQEQDQKIAKERATALPQSEQILKEATDRSIEEMYRLLVATSSVEINSNDPNIDKAELICKISTDIPNWELQVLDLNKVNLDVMIPEIKTLVTEVRKEKLKKFEKLSNNNVISSTSSSVIIDFKEFSTLVRICLKKRNGPGRAYVYAPKKKPQVTLELIQNELQEETHQPVIDKVSAAIAKDRYLKKDVSGAAQPRSIEEVLIKEGKKVQEKVEIARKQKQDQEVQGLKFKPNLFKTPKNVIPRYRGLPVYEIDKSASTDYIVEEKKTIRGGKKPTKPTSPRKPTTPKLNNLTTSEKLISVVWNSLSGHHDNAIDENENKVDINVPPPQLNSNPPHPEKQINIGDKVTNRKTLKGSKKKTATEE